MKVIRFLIGGGVLVGEVIFVDVVDRGVALSGAIVAVALFLILRIALALAVTARLSSAVGGGIGGGGEYHAHEYRDYDEERDDA